MNVVKARIRQAARGTGFVGITAAMLPMFLAALHRTPEAERDATREAWVRRWAALLLRLFDITVVVRGEVPAPTRSGQRGRLIVANHRSAIDIGVLLSTFGGTMLSRADLATWPVLGAAARSVGTVFVERTSARSGAEAIRTIQRHLEDGRTIALFPEGTTFAGDEVRPFHGGAFVAAVRAQAEILPVGLAYPSGSGAAFLNETFLAHLGRMASSGSTRMGLAVGAPIAFEKGIRAGALADRAHAAVSELVGVARAVAGP